MDRFVQTYTVRGRWPFPLDMLRRDQSQPATGADAALVAQLSKDHPDDLSEVRSVVEVTLRMEHPNRVGPNRERWKSFQWEVVAPVDPMDAARDEASRMRSLRESALAKLTSDEIEALRWHGLDATH